MVHKSSHNMLPLHFFLIRHLCYAQAPASAEPSMHDGCWLLMDYMSFTSAVPPCRFKAGDYVRVKPENAAVRYRKPHLRVPGRPFMG